MILFTRSSAEIFFRSAALMLSVRDVPTGATGIGGLQKSLPDSFAGLCRHPESLGGLEKSTLSKFVIGNIVLVVGIAGGTFVFYFGIITGATCSVF